MEDVFKDIGLTLFKTCGLCHRIWSDREDFLRCSDLALVGYQANFYDPEAGFLLFTHSAESCGNIIVISASKFSDLYTGKRYPKPKFGTDVCEHRCTDMIDMNRCRNQCKYAYVREILQIVKKRLAA